MVDQVIEGGFSPEYLDWRRLRRTVEESGGDPAGVFIYLSKLLDDDRWMALQDSDNRLFRSFKSFVEDPDRGIGMPTVEFMKLLDVHGVAEKRGDYDGTVDFDWVRARVKDLMAQVASKHGELGNGRSRESGTHSTSLRDAAAILSRLKRDDPELAEQVIDGSVTANAAALQKGWRRPRIVLSSPTSVATQIRKHWTPEQIDALQEALS